jgi:hypothetical protein
VAAIVVITLLAVIPVFLLRPAPVLGSPLLLVLADGNITASPLNGTVPADFGPHCAQWWWNDRRDVLTMETTAQVPDAGGLLLQHYERETANLASTGGDFVRARFLAHGTGWSVTSPVDEHVLAQLDRQGENVTVDGASHPPRDAWEMTFAYDAATDQGTVHVVEVVRFRNLGVVTPHLVPPAACA